MADYSAGEEIDFIPALQLAIVEDIFRNSGNLSEAEIADRLEDFQNSLLTPVSFLVSPTSIPPTPTLEPTQIATTQLLPIFTSTPTPTESQEEEPRPTTKVVDTSTPVDTQTNTPIPDTPTNTPVPDTPTNTPVPDTATATSETCIFTASAIDVDGGAKALSVDISNNGTAAGRIDEIRLTWPVGNGNLTDIFLGTRQLYEPDLAPVSATINSGWSLGVGTRQINNADSDTLIFYFANTPGLTGYDITVLFNVDCEVSVSN
jgi:hypothetical protein